MSPLGEGLRVQAKRVQAIAAAVEVDRAAIAAADQELAWHGARAERFRQRGEATGRHLARAAVELRTLAVQLERAAEQADDAWRAAEAAVDGALHVVTAGVL